MSMMIKGTVVRVSYKEEREFKDKETGVTDKMPHGSVLQVLSEAGGRLSLQDLSLDGDDFDKLKALEGKEVFCPVRTWVDRRTQAVRIFPEKDCFPEVLGPGVFKISSQPAGVTRSASSSPSSTAAG